MPRTALIVAFSLLIGCSSGPEASPPTPGGAPSASGGAPLVGAGGAGATQGGAAVTDQAGAAALGGAATNGGGGASGHVGGSGGAGSAAIAGGAGGAGSAGSGGGGGAAITACQSHAGATTLAAKYGDCFPIGAAVDASSYKTHGALLKQHFNSVTPENEMKFDSLQHTQGTFTYAAADGIVDFARSNNMRVRGHTLVWHRQNPSWLFSGSADMVLAKLKAHIDAVVGHYKGKLYAWDVVNEAIMNDGKYRTGNESGDQQSSPWYQALGKSYIAEAFKYAHAADPDAKLFYNDFYNYLPDKQQGIYDMLKELRDAGVPVHGVGLQCHLNIQPASDMTHQGYYQDVLHLEQAIKLYASLGLEVQVTELDLSLYVPGVSYTQDQFYTAATFTDEIKAKQAARYREFFELFRKYGSAISGVTFWGIADDNTWLSEFDSGRQDFPLLFDGNHAPKPAYDAVMDF
jgi:endo-1,4-beta-xylanase